LASLRQGRAPAGGPVVGAGHGRDPGKCVAGCGRRLAGLAI